MLELKAITMGDTPLVDSVVTLKYEVVHNVSSLRTRLTLPLSLQLNLDTNKVKAALDVSCVEADSVDEALDRLANWCDRSAEALRERARKPGIELPVFTRLAFDYETLTTWQKQLYDQVVADLGALPEDEEGDYIKRMHAEHHPIVFLRDALESARAAVANAREAD
ncbi:hypothetical protein [Burkholderia ambifaria]|uniref:hypothetical protein n=1 Tax=Burkholderia ambifaria TaxID=152480 RepID=UPI000F803685|nr:hypothetical protein [Burkholderia ambifaria]